MFAVCTDDQHDTSKTPFNPNQSEFPIKQNTSVTFFASLESKSRLFKISFSYLADIQKISSEHQSSRNIYKISISKVFP